MPLGGLPTFPTTEPSSVLTFNDLILEVAYKIGVAYYGSDGQGALQIPVDARDLDLCMRIVNKAIRMFINDGPGPNGWKWLNPVAQMDIWPLISADTSGSTTYVTSTSYNSTYESDNDPIELRIAGQQHEYFNGGLVPVDGTSQHLSWWQPAALHTRLAASGQQSVFPEH